MSEQHFSGVPSPIAKNPPPVFLSVKPGQFVVVQDVAPVGHKESTHWWMGQVIFCEGGARDPKVNSLFQITDVDDGEIHWVNADQVSHVLHGLDGINGWEI